MKRVVILSATSKSNLELAKSLETILSKLNVTTKIINLEEYSFPLYSSSKEEEGPRRSGRERRKAESIYADAKLALAEKKKREAAKDKKKSERSIR